MMRAYCQEARRYGDKCVGVDAKPRHVTVILNPVAKDSKGKKLYEDYCSPLLNLAGIHVSLVSTEREAQARDLMEIMANTDAVIVAGGDGTLHEAVTGLLRRDEASPKFIIGIAPIGRNNRFAKLLFKFNSEAQLLAETTMAVIEETVRTVDVIRVQGAQNKPVFALSQLDFGTLRDTDATFSKYWYFGFLKSKMAYLISAIKGLTSPFNISLSYIEACCGCSRCFVKPTVKEGRKKWWASFGPKIAPVISPPEVEDRSLVVNEECGKWHHEDLMSSNFSFLANTAEEARSMKAILVEPLTTRSRFIQKGWNRHDDHKDKVISFAKAHLKITLPQDQEEECWLSIDNENYEAQEDLHLTLLPSKILLYGKKE